MDIFGYPITSAKNTSYDNSISGIDADNIQDAFDSTILTYQINVESLSDFPTPVAGVIYLVANTTYLITTHIDIGANRFDCTGGTVGLLGFSSEISSLTSSTTGALITCNNVVILRWISFTATAGSVLALDGSLGVNPAPALDWVGVNFLNCATIGYIKDYNNFIGFSMALLTSGNLTFDGSFGTIAFDTCIFTIPTTASIIIPATCTITRRFRITQSSFVTLTTNNAIDFNTSATVPNEQYILNQCNFAGGATTYLAGVLSTDIKSSHLNNSGIINSRTLSNYYMVGNATETAIAVTGTYYKILGTTTPETLSQRFDETTANRAVYLGVNTSVFKVSTTISIIDGNNVDYGTRIAKNGTTIISTSSFFTSTGNGKASNISSQSIVELSTGDYIEVFVANLTNTGNPTIVDFNCITVKIDT